GLKYVFDMRGFWADERVDGCLWPKDGWLYHMAKGLESRFLLAADRVVSLTQAAVEEMRCFPYLQARMPKFEVITTCTDLDLFKPDASEQSTQKDDRPFTLGYVGTVGVWYLFDETLQCFKLLRQVIPDARLHILNRGDHAYIREQPGASRAYRVGDGSPFRVCEAYRCPLLHYGRSGSVDATPLSSFMAN
ncbi:hypothetical protein KJ656_02400, partial [bacterium]|nr:hypothetical protein [bacterium]